MVIVCCMIQNIIRTIDTTVPQTDRLLRAID